MEEGHVNDSIPSLFNIATKRIIETATAADCDELLQHATKRRQHFNDAELREMLRALPHLAAFGDLIDTVSIVVNTGDDAVILFVYANVQYHFIWMGHSYTARCTPNCNLNGHNTTDDTYVTSRYTCIGRTNRPSNPSDWPLFIQWLEAMDMDSVQKIVRAYTKTLKLKRVF